MESNIWLQEIEDSFVTGLPGTQYERQILMQDSLSPLCSEEVFAWDIDFNDQFIHHTHIPFGQETQCSFDEFLCCVHHQDRDKVLDFLSSKTWPSRENIEMEIRIRTTEEYERYKVRGTVRQCGAKVFAAGSACNIGHIQKRLVRHAFLQTHDHLTGLGNSEAFEAFFKDASELRRFPVALVTANIENVKEINDTMGYHAGNMLIKKVADVLKDCFSDAQMIARTGGGEYCAIFLGKDRLEIGLRIREAQMTLHRLYLNLVKTQVTFGYALSGRECDLQTLYRQAMETLYRVKSIRFILDGRSVVDRISEIISRKAGWGKRTVRLQSLSAQIAAQLGCSEEECGEAKALAKLADIGLIGIDDRLLRNRTGLGGKDRMEYLLHVEIGRKIISSIDLISQMEGAYLDIYKRYDEWKDAISLPARIVAGAMGFDDAASGYGVHMEEMEHRFYAQKGALYCPAIVDAVVSVARKHHA